MLNVYLAYLRCITFTPILHRLIAFLPSIELRAMKLHFNSTDSIHTMPKPYYPRTGSVDKSYFLSEWQKSNFNIRIHYLALFSPIFNSIRDTLAQQHCWRKPHTHEASTFVFCLFGQILQEPLMGKRGLFCIPFCVCTVSPFYAQTTGFCQAELTATTFQL